MKNKLLVSVFMVVLIASCMTSCREKTDFDAIVTDLSMQTLRGYFSGSEGSESEMKLNVIQFQFMDDNTVTRTVATLGDGEDATPETRKFSSWELGEYYDGKAGRFLYLYPEDGGEMLTVKFYAGGIIEEGQPVAGDKNDKVGSIIPSQEALVGKKWCGYDTVYYKIDTVINIMKYDTTYTYKPKKDPETGKTMRDDEGHIIYEQTISKIDSTLVPTKMKVPFAPKTINVRKLEVNRDASFANTGTWYMEYKEYDMSADRVITLKADTTSAYDFHWCFESYSSPAAYIIRARQADGTDEYFDIKYDAKVPAITLDKQVLKIEE